MPLSKSQKVDQLRCLFCLGYVKVNAKVAINSQIFLIHAAQKSSFNLPVSTTWITTMLSQNITETVEFLQNLPQPGSTVLNGLWSVKNLQN